MKKMQKEMVAWRRYLHENAEVGFSLQKTTEFIQNELIKMGYAPQKCGKGGIIAEVGQGETLLLRADMDGLPIREETGSAYACITGNMHACGHDMHTAMLLGAAKFLKLQEKSLKGKIRFLFQPAEEILEGAKNAIESGVLEKVKGAVALHVMTNVPLPIGTVVVGSGGVGAPAADFFTIEVKGKGCHGSAPWNGVDAVSVAAHIVLALEGFSARELNPGSHVVLTIGAFQAGGAGNVIADFAKLKGTLRAFDEKERNRVKERLQAIVQNVAKSFRASANVAFEGGCPTLVNDEEMSIFAQQVATECLGKEKVFTSAHLSRESRERSGGSEDFAYISQKVPSVLVAIAAGESGKGYPYPLHHPKVEFDEKALCVGASIYAHMGIRYGEK